MKKPLENDMQLLRDSSQYPNRELLANALGNSFPAYEELMGILSSAEKGLVAEWNYYNDGKAWLCKVASKNKTVFWLSVWKDYFKTGFYFTEQTGFGISALDIAGNIKEDFASRKPVCKLRPLTITIKSKEQMEDLVKVIDYKMGAKQ